jgi:hypothetical protein
MVNPSKRPRFGRKTNFKTKFCLFSSFVATKGFGWQVASRSSTRTAYVVSTRNDRVAGRKHPRSRAPWDPLLAAHALGLIRCATASLQRLVRLSVLHFDGVINQRQLMRALIRLGSWDSVLPW